MIPLPLSFPPRLAARPLVAGALVLVLALGAAACGGDDDDADGGSTDAGAGATTTPVVIGQVQTFDVASRNHTDLVQTYPQTPPVGGDHAPIWQNCGFYDTPIYKETGVHSLEHGAVWITFRADLPADQVGQVQTYAQQPFTLASPWDPADGELPAPVVLSAWGAQVALESLPDPKADDFIATYRQSPDAPEPGAPCTGGLDATKETGG